jgi:hypothetical protein
VVKRALGVEPLPVQCVEHPPGPFLTINGRIHRPTSDFLRTFAQARPETATARRYASDLCSWIDYLCNVRGYHPHEDHRDPVFQATEQDFAAYWRRRQYGEPSHRLSSDGWKNARKSIKRFYEHAQRAYFHPPPFNIRTFQSPEGWRGTKIEGYAPRRHNTGSAGVPLTPAWADQLLLGALRLTLDGAQKAFAGADRDHALISLALATGMRRQNLVHVTTYEIPPVAELPLTVTQVADLITKNGAGGDALTFTHRLPAVHGYMGGARREDANRRPYRPQRPLHLISADRRRFSFRDPHVEPQAVHTRSWAEADAQLRRRLVNPDGTSPVLFLNTLTGAPLAYNSAQHVVPDAAAHVRQHINPDFPADFRLHDLRHTYAVHLTVAIYRDVLRDTLRANARPSDSWVVDHIAQAVELTKTSLGHASSSSTNLYIQTAHRFLGIPIEHFLGDA